MSYEKEGLYPSFTSAADGACRTRKTGIQPPKCEFAPKGGARSAPPFGAKIRVDYFSQAERKRTSAVLDEGVIKFACDWQQGPPLEQTELATLVEWRDRIFTLGFIGTYPNGIGYGNISQKQSAKSFVISGTQTGHLAHTSPEHYTVVDGWDVEQNSLHCTGPVKASSESLTHAALYDYSSDIQAIIHIHHPELWRTYQYVLPTTEATVPYGTPAMAHEMWRLMEASNLPQQKILVMAGHEDGIIAFGETLAEVGDRLCRLH